jgi:threonine/homoserine/homoserine lactone efflux protein
MPAEMLLALVWIAIVASFTPGPNNLMVTTSGVNFGFVRTIPHMLGVEVGFLVLLAACAGGLGALFAGFPASRTGLKIAGALYMAWLAWKLANAAGTGEDDPALAKPLSFLQAFAFQWVNPKAVIFALTVTALYLRPGHATGDFAIVIAVFGVTTILSVATWTGFGVGLRALINEPRRARIFNVVMAVLLVASIVPMVL